MIELLYAKHARELMIFILGDLGQKDANDVFQETWLRVAKGLASFDGVHPRAWLFQIAKNIVRNQYYKMKPEIGAAEDSGTNVVANISTIMEQLVAEEEYARFRFCLARLERELRVVVELRIQGVRNKRIAEKLERSEAWTTTRFNTAKQLLSECVHTRNHRADK